MPRTSRKLLIDRANSSNSCEVSTVILSTDSRAKTDVASIVTSAVEVETTFVRDALNVDLIGMNAEMMCQYIDFVADRLLVSLGCKKHYNAVNPFDFMEMISLQGKTNFFEKRVAEYQKSGVMSDKESMSFSLSEDF